MKTRLRAGEEVDFLSPAELDRILTEHISGFLRAPETVRDEPAFQLNSSGNTARGGTATIALPIFRVPNGQVVRVHRLGFFPDGYTFGAPYTSATGYLEIHRNGVPVDGLPLSSPGFPFVWSAGTADALEYKDGEAIGILISGGPASAAVRVSLQGTIEPMISQ